MAEEKIARKDLWKGLDGIKQKDWLVAGKRLGVEASKKGGNGSHAVLRDPRYPDPSDTRGLISTIQKKLFKQANQAIFKQLLNYGFSEDEIWQALGKL